MTDNPIIVWFRSNLRLADNPLLNEAADSGAPVLPLYIADENSLPGGAGGSATQGWHLANARELAAVMQDRFGAQLTLRTGDPVQAICELALETKAGSVYFEEPYDSAGNELAARLKLEGGKNGFAIRAFPGRLLMDPGMVRTGGGKSYKVFTPYYRQFIRTYRHLPPLPPPEHMVLPDRWPASADRGLMPVQPELPPGGRAALDRLEGFIRDRINVYAEDRDRLDLDATSLLSPYLACGAISPRQVWDRVVEGEAGTGDGAAAFLRQLVWREFCYCTLVNNPHLAEQPLRPEFSGFPWAGDPGMLECWQQGMTGYPLVDAAMRQLSRTGLMHGRARMVVASFLVKHLMQPWVNGEQWFREKLLDYDPALNGFNWQWVAGCGLDAAPYFRIFNPVLQGRKFDPGGDYVRKHMPELAGLPAKYIHAPWTAPEGVLRLAGVRLGETYPRPVVDHASARLRALDAYYSLKTISD